MDPQHPNHHGERGLRALTSSPVEAGTTVPGPPSRHRRPGSTWYAGFDHNSQYDRFLLRARSRDPGRRCWSTNRSRRAYHVTGVAAQMATEPRDRNWPPA
jgi:hypothetical protein